jgi:adenylosuccinate synthase
MLPSGVFYQHITNILGNGVALNIPFMVRELHSLEDSGVPTPNLLVSDRAQVVMPYHILFDEYEEDRLGGRSFGSTKSGIAPMYADKYAKIGLQVQELFDEEHLKEKVGSICEQKNVLLEHLYHKPMLDPAELLETCRKYREMVRPYVAHTSDYLSDAIAPCGRITKPTFVINGTGADSLVLEIEGGAMAEFFDTFGKSTGCKQIDGGVMRVKVPPSGYVKLIRHE